VITCDWPDGCTRPSRANGKCASHDVMWARRHGRPKKPKRRGTEAWKAPRAGNALTKQNLARLLALLRWGPKTLSRLASDYSASTSATLRALRQLEASGLRIHRAANPTNGREILRHVTEAEARRYLKALKEEK
jgi:DNA-binding MarR family transcriptional regulator